MQSKSTNIKTPALKEANIKLIGRIKKELKDIIINDVCQILGYSRQNLHLHLAKKKLDTVSKANHLKAIYEAIQTVKLNNSSTAASVADHIKTLL